MQYMQYTIILRCSCLLLQRIANKGRRNETHMAAAAAATSVQDESPTVGNVGEGGGGGKVAQAMAGDDVVMQVRMQYY